MSPIERAHVVDQLPSEIELGPPEGDLHRVPKQRGLEALDAFFRRMGRRVYLSSELLQRANLVAEQLQQRMGYLEGLLVAETEQRERAEADKQRAEADKQRAEARVLELEAEIERLRSRP